MAHTGHTATKHMWRFWRAGGFDQVRLDSGADLLALDQLDQKLWVALSCPTRGLEFDPRTLDLIDTDHDGRIRAPEILAATRWACALLKSPDALIHRSAALPLAAINDATPEGRQLLASARQILSDLGKAGADAITLEETADTARIFAQTKFNGDGIIPPGSADDPQVKAVIEEIIACLGSVTDRSGLPGVNQEMVDHFFAAARGYCDWWTRAESQPAVLPVGEAIAAAEAALAAVRPKINDYFVRCRLAAFDPRAVAAMNRQEDDYLVLATKDLAIDSAEIAALPLSQIAADKPLGLKSGLNPAWAVPMTAFEAQVVRPLMGQKEELTDAQWQALKDKFVAFEAWSAEKPGLEVEKLGFPRLRDLVSGGSRAAIAALIARDQALAGEANAIASVDRLIRYHCDLHTLLTNFVSFKHFYGRSDKAVFQAGTLYLDQRSCDLCVRVDDSARHALLAHLSQVYLAYCDLSRPATGEKMSIAAAFTRGHSDNLVVGRNGIFYDRQGRDWDATITRIIDNPISVRQAFWSPYKRLIRWLSDQVAKRASSAALVVAPHLQSAVTSVVAHDGVSTVTTEVASAPTPTPAPAPAAPPKKLDIGIVAALGVAMGGIMAGLGYMADKLFGLSEKIGTVNLVALVIIGGILLISTPSMIIAWLKLRQRNLGPILDANGWAVNTRARINIPFGASLTHVAVLPEGSQRNRRDPYAEKKHGRNGLVLALVLGGAALGLWYFGVFEKICPGLFPKSSWVIGQLGSLEGNVINGSKSLLNRALPSAANSAASAEKPR